MAKEQDAAVASATMSGLATMPTTEATALIAVTQLPIITERLRDVKTAVEATVAEAKSMVATADTIQAVKARRAELNKQFKELETQRKAVKAQIMEPYNRFEAVYKECITTPFGEADRSLAATVDEFQSEVKKKALVRLQEYYEELCSMEGINWLPFSTAMQKSGTKISMEDCKKKEPTKAMDAIGSFVGKIGTDLDQIRKMEDSAEIMVEYRQSLNIGAAIATVQERKRSVQKEKEEQDARQQEEARRQAMIEKVKAYKPPAATPEPTADPVEPEEQTFPVFRFTVYNCTRSQLIKIREYLKQEGIQYA